MTIRALDPREAVTHMGSRPTGDGTLTQNDMDVIRERRFGWEKASPKLLAAVFGVSVQRINAVCNHLPIFKSI